MLCTFPEGTSAAFRNRFLTVTGEWFPSRECARCECGCPVGLSLPFPAHTKEWSRMNPVEYAPARRHRLRKVLYDVALGVVANLVVAALTAAASLLF